MEESKKPEDSGSSEIKKEYSPAKEENHNDEKKEGSKFESNCVIDVIEWLSSNNFLPELKKWELEDLTRLASNFSKWPDAALSKRVIEDIVIIAEEKLSGGASLNREMLCAFAQLLIDRPNESWSCNLMQKVVAEFLSARSKDKQFTMSELSKLARGFGKWPDQECCHKALKEISILIQKDLPTADITEDEISEFVFALFNWSDKDWIEDTMKVISNAAVKKVMGGKRFTKNRLVKLALAFSNWHNKAWSFEVVRIIALNNTATFGAGVKYTKEELVNFAIAFSKFADRKSQNIYSAMQWTYYVYYSYKEEFTLRLLCNLAIAFGRWPQETWSLTVAREVLQKFDLKVLNNLSVQERCAFSKVLRRLPYWKLSKAEKLPFLLLTYEPHKKPSALGRFLEKFLPKSGKKVQN